MAVKTALDSQHLRKQNFRRKTSCLCSKSSDNDEQYKKSVALYIKEPLSFGCPKNNNDRKYENFIMMMNVLRKIIKSSESMLMIFITYTN